MFTDFWSDANLPLLSSLTSLEQKVRCASFTYPAPAQWEDIRAIECRDSRFGQMIRRERRRKLRLVLDIMLKSPKRGWFAAVLIVCAVNRTTIDDESVYYGFKLM